MGLRIVITTEADVVGVERGRAEQVVQRSVRAVLEDRGIEEAEVSVTLLDDAAMAALNWEWKGRGSATDVLAFSLYQEGEPPLGDIYLGAQRVAEQASEAGEPPERELARLAIHGTLHVLGFDHPEAERERSELWRHQERILSVIETG